MPTIDKIRRDALQLWLDGARLPLTAVETVAQRHTDTSSWPPALMFARAEAAV